MLSGPMPAVLYGCIDPGVFPYTGAGVVGQRAVVGQSDKFLLPLLIQRAAASFPQDALSKTTRSL